MKIFNLFKKEPFEVKNFYEKAQHDWFDYVVILNTGNHFRCCYIEELNNGWVRLIPWDEDRGMETNLPYPCPRGIDVRKDSIIAVADAPHGS